MNDAQREWERQQVHRATERELQAHFAGRRGALRTEKSLRCRVAGQAGAFNARLVDVSRSGALVVIVDSRFSKGEEVSQLMRYTELVWQHFPDGLELEIPGSDVSAVATVVRVKIHNGESRFPFQLGLHFRTELTPDECDRLGVEHSDDRSDAEEIDNSVADAIDRLLAGALSPARGDRE